MKKYIEVLNSISIAVAGLSIIFITLIGGLDAITTVLFSMPIHATYEATEMALTMVVFLSLGYLQMKDQNIAVDILSSKLSRRFRKVQSILVQILSAAFFAILSWQAWLMFMESWTIREYSLGLIAFPIYPSKFAVVIGSVLTVICSTTKLVLLLKCADSSEAMKEVICEDAGK